MGLLNSIKKRLRPKITVDIKYLENANEFDGKVAVVFGGAGGIGSAIAKKLMAGGAKTIICDKSHYGDASIDFYNVDLLHLENTKEVIDSIIKKYGKIDILVNAHGICPLVDFGQDFFNITPDDFDLVFQINTKSVFFLCQYLCNYFLKTNRQGRILNIVSTESLKGSIVPYGLSKAALLSFTKGIGKKMIKYGVVVNGISPGATATKMMRYSNDLYKEYIPSKRMCVPEEIAQLAVYLLSDKAVQMPGQVVTIDGGESLF